MQKEKRFKNVRLTFSQEEHKELKKLKGSLTWEEFILVKAGLLEA